MFDIIIKEKLASVFRAQTAFGMRVRLDVNAKFLSTYRAGGNVSLVSYPKTPKELLFAYESAEGLPVAVLGNGSNVLIPDSGYGGMAICTRLMSEDIVVSGNTIEISTGASLSRLIRCSTLSGLDGLEELSGIPATVGGAIYMNAGAFGREIAETLSRIELVDTISRKSYKLSASELHPTYRNGGLPKNVIISRATFTLSPSNADPDARVREIIQRRKALHPTQPSLGSVFRKPEGGVSAGYYIDKCGLKATRIGGAEISAKHANFIVNVGNGSASDYLRLAELAKSVVKRKFDVDLREEIRVLKTE